MMTSRTFVEAWTPRVTALMRIVTGYLFLQHGTAKLLHRPHIAMFDQVQPFSLIGFAGMLELVGGILILIGLGTRAAAFVLSGEMAFAYFIGHALQGNALIPSLNGGEPAVFIALSFCCCR